MRYARFRFSLLGLILLSNGCDIALKQPKSSSENKIDKIDQEEEESLTKPSSTIVLDVPPPLPVAETLPPPPYGLVPILPEPNFDDGKRTKCGDKNKPCDYDWPRWGQNRTNNHHNSDTFLSTKNVDDLARACAIDHERGSESHLAGSTSSEPIIVHDVVYWTSFSGKIGAAEIIRNDHDTIIGCEDLWVVDVKTLLGITIADAFPASRISPAYYVTDEGRGALLYLAPSTPFSFANPFEGNASPIVAFALDAETGDEIFSLNITEPGVENPDDAFESATSSPAIHDNVAYFGISSANNAFPIPQTFRGQIVALDLDKEKVKWRQFMLPEKPANFSGEWFAGAGVWVSGASILPNAGKKNEGLVFFGTGQLYSYPSFVADCMTEPVPPQMFNDYIADLRGETGGGEVECYKRAVAELASMGITHPLAANSVVALNVDDGSFAWHYNTQGIDAWQVACGSDSTGGPNCTVPVVGPDWDISGSAPVLATVDGKDRLISHTKGGAVFVFDALTGEKIYNIDLCVGSPVGGIHWGLSYDPVEKNILAACSGGSATPFFGITALYREVLADGTETCSTGFVNAIDLRSGKLQWQFVPAQAAPLVPCPETDYTPDLRFKSGLDFNFVYKNKVLPSVAVNVAPFSDAIPVQEPALARMHSAPSSAGGMVFASTVHGTVYVFDASTGEYLNQIHCDEGGIYQGVSITDDAVSFGCGYSFGPSTLGESVMVYSLKP